MAPILVATRTSGGQRTKQQMLLKAMLMAYKCRAKELGEKLRVWSRQRLGISQGRGLRETKQTYCQLI